MQIRFKQLLVEYRLLELFVAILKFFLAQNSGRQYDRMTLRTFCARVNVIRSFCYDY